MRWRFRLLTKHPLRDDVETAQAVDTVTRLAVLLRAGVTPARAWSHLAAVAGRPAGAAADASRGGGEHLGSTPADRVVQEVDAALAAGEDPAPVFARAGGPWLDIGAAWRIAAIVGAPLAASLRDLASALRDGQRAADEVRVTLAEPAATARLMGWLPLLGLALGGALGFDVFAAFAGNPAGVVCLLSGLALIVIARRWTAALVRRAQSPPGVPGMTAELTAMALSGGASIERARALVAEASESLAASGRVRGAEGNAEIEEVLALSRSAGVPAVELLRSAAWLERHRARTAARLRAAALSSRLLLPLGVCTLPAFLLLGVAPMMLSILSSGVLMF